MTPQLERRKTTTIQRVSLALDISQIVAIASLAFAYGQQSQEVKQMRADQEQQRQQSTGSQQTINAAVARIDVIENKGESTQVLVRDLKGDLNERLRRIEDKLDQQKRR